MSSAVTPQYLLEGAVYALEQCGLLLRDANILYRNGSYALAAFAREELGRSKILSDMRSDALGGKIFTLEEIKNRCKDHEIKQQAGMLSTVMETDRDSVLGQLLRKRHEASPGTTQRKETDEELAKIDRLQRKRVPSDRHEKRMSALYVEPISVNQWNRPADTSRSSAEKFLQHAVNDYAVRTQSYITSADSILKEIDPELYSALEKWSDRPELPRPEWPHDTGS